MQVTKLGVVGYDWRRMNYCRKHKQKVQVSCLDCREEKEQGRGTRQAKADRQRPRARKEKYPRLTQYTYVPAGTFWHTTWLVAGGTPLFSEPLSLPTEEGTLIEGWRQYYVGFDAEGWLILYGIQRPWPNVEMEARCFDGGAADHLSRGECSCGIYVARHPADPDYAAGGLDIRARVSAWGTCVEYERGWRCEHVRIEALYVGGKNPYLLSQLAERYDVPVVPLATLEMTR